jgi:hypothetical protein
MQTIYKYPLSRLDVEDIEMPQGAKPLAVQVQGGQPCLWALVDPDRPKEVRRFLTFGTGHPVSENVGAYLGTFQLIAGSLVFHLFEQAA